MAFPQDALETVSWQSLCKGSIYSCSVYSCVPGWLRFLATLIADYPISLCLEIQLSKIAFRDEANSLRFLRSIRQEQTAWLSAAL